MSIQETNLKAIADAIREKDGTTGPISAADFPDRIRAISSVPEGLRTITLTAAPPEGGTVEGGGMVSDGMMVTVKAVAGSEYEFKEWQENGAIISKSAEYTFPVTGDRELVAISEVRRLPLGYTEVQYIEITSETSALTLTNRTLHATSIFDSSWSYTTDVNAIRYFMTCKGSGTEKIEAYLTRTHSAYFMCGTSSNTNSTYDNVYAGTPFRLRLNLSGRNKYVYVNSKLGNAAWSNSSITPVVIGRSSSSLIGGRLYSMKASCSSYPLGNSAYSFYNWELVPCITDDGKIGLYDVINKTSFLSTSEDFTAGPAV